MLFKSRTYLTLKRLSLSDCACLAVAMGCWLLTVCGCGGLSPVKPPDVDADEAAGAAILEYDSNGDGQLSAEELKKLPAIKLKDVDSDNNGQLSADELAARLRQWTEGRAGILSFHGVVTLDGSPLSDAEVMLDPEPFLGDAVKPAQGTTRSGDVIVKIDPELLPLDQRTLRGVHPGLYKVRITHPSIKIPARYNTETILGQEILPGTSGAKYALTSR
jgi:hypothetical protein